MRIIAGQWRGLHLADVGKGDPAAHLRPTSDRVREAIFNLLVNGGYGDPIKGARVLDLFAGTGALALEALSRGAAEAVLVDDGQASRALIGKNIALCRGASVRHLRLNATRLPANAEAARRIGIPAIRFQSPQQAAREAAALGLPVSRLG